MYRPARIRSRLFRNSSALRYRKRRLQAEPLEDRRMLALVSTIDESPDHLFTAGPSALDGGFYLQRVTPVGGAGSPFDRMELHFSQAVRAGSFALEDVRFEGPSGEINCSELNQLAADRYELVCTAGTGLDSYTLTIGPDVLADATGDPMDQDHDDVPGEVEDAYIAALFANGATIADGDTTYDDQSLVVYGNTVTISGVHAFDTFSVHGGATVHANGDTLDTYNLYLDGASTLNIAGGATATITDALTVAGNSTIVCQGKNRTGQVDGEWAGVGVAIHASDVTVEAGSVISADGQGYTKTAGPGGGADWYIGGSHGGRGSGGAAPTYGSLMLPVDLGSGGYGPAGSWSNGGGAIQLEVTGTLTLDGEITADGQSGGNHNHSAAGGSVLIHTGTLAGSGRITADANDGYHADGGGGRVAVYYAHDGGFTGFATSTASASGAEAEHGTCGFFDTSVPNMYLYVFQKFVYPQDATPHLGAVTVTDAGELYLGGGSLLIVDGQVTVSENSTIICQGKNRGAQVDGEWAGEGVMINAGSITVDTGSVITADGQGYGTGPGYGNGAGGSYGGVGNSGAATYGSAIAHDDRI
jgi:hypothetical protein